MNILNLGFAFKLYFTSFKLHDILGGILWTLQIQTLTSYYPNGMDYIVPSMGLGLELDHMAHAWEN